ncbi:4Fe-4S dicluster domain-containing protein [Sulfitobacter faviae]|uniref:4Fe-4S dicluster domain-containing protein n=1 Tax=Sulfitobacter faviae TaxID=1775881 RepID=UPI003CCEE858
MARAKFLCDAERCIECNACVTACKNEHEVPWGINRRRVVTIQDGQPGERSISSPAATARTRPAWRSARWIVLPDRRRHRAHSKDLCIGCGYCFYACPFGAPQPAGRNFGSRARWTNAPSAPARKRTTPKPSSRSTVATGSRKASCRSARDVLDQGAAGR